MSKQEQLQHIIDHLRSAIPELQGVMVASTDGLPIAYSMAGTDPTRVAAMAATALGLGKRISETLNAGTLSETSVTGSSAQILIYAAGTKGVLAVVAPSWSSVGLIHLEARDATRKIAEML
ncbi:roadblock/LC7 domain-containing protein [Deinococcus cellulosilyticus]|uniref:Roadblock/LAMTOR2 domain-containing protein n=1 Tax=Deinococcus cellulosilyticus (strain DSM 18568 / NBRC 106333 / KACC 11606 / 5516J-15) TaxID=1223518 RepID=A0A511MYL0_DEIC1|nr:roadblock/LC7 domain-containing protein [Deinococcus cellulosilyticus]GEM45441.1 hypothetical protein DC3_10760 [Deinococcus cellulosilyticus NBRC 106333 = KACC 11606]